MSQSAHGKNWRKHSNAGQQTSTNGHVNNLVAVPKPAVLKRDEEKKNIGEKVSA
ncbi:hypothetical protein LTR62_003508 [Meristemomyces frigidus]|uniref:Uncharacterized protein n=1 Tax=Meristemomyces frigidus TaxID=1508187 RepID=A0AAN7YGX3_9PEZI|nr:hypothetical protein LTR62_003508 [Meristemomyces frigidus]